MKHTAFTAGVFLLAVLLAGCGTEAETTAATDPVPSGGSETGVFALHGSGDFPQAETPQVAARAAQAVFSGTLDGFEDGRTEITYNDDGSQEFDRFVVMRIKVDQVFKDEGIGLESGYAYLTRPRGVEVADGDGEILGAGGTVTEVAAFETVLPIGTRLLVMAPREKIAQIDHVEVVEASEGAPDGAVLLNVYNPQTLLAEDVAPNPVTGWQELSVPFSDVVRQVADVFSGSN